jgi:gamma-glutamylcyclotransferase (GGCT)/AIG2-like uncharacterized protein YtfP
MTETNDLFAYGSLMCPDIMAAVSGLDLEGRQAVLPGYRRLLVRGEQYPGVVPAPEASVTGVVYQNITPEGWARLDRFEGVMYERSPVGIAYNDGGSGLVCCYLFKPAFHDRLTSEDWDFAAFLRQGKTIFQNQYCGFQALD